MMAMTSFVLLGILHGECTHCRLAMGIDLAAGVTGPTLATAGQCLIWWQMLRSHTAHHPLLCCGLLLSLVLAASPCPSYSPETTQTEAHIGGSLKTQEKLRHKRWIDHGVDNYIQGQLQCIQCYADHLQLLNEGVIHLVGITTE